MKVKYTVSVGVDNFEFEDGMTSIGIAELLVNNFVPGKYNKKLTVLITVKKDEAEEDEDAGKTDEEADEADD